MAKDVYLYYLWAPRIVFLYYSQKIEPAQHTHNSQDLCDTYYLQMTLILIGWLVMENPDEMLVAMQRKIPVSYRRRTRVSSKFVSTLLLLMSPVTRCPSKVHWNSTSGPGFVTEHSKRRFRSPSFTVTTPLVPTNSNSPLVSVTEIHGESIYYIRCTTRLGSGLESDEVCQYSKVQSG